MSKWVAALLRSSLLALAILSACQTNDLPAPQDGVAPSVEPPLSQTPVPECVSLPAVKLDVVLLSENEVQIQVTGLRPHEPVHVIFSSQSNGAGKMIEYGSGQSADENGTYKSSQGLRAPNTDAQFSDWEVRVIHSGVSTCATFVLPEQ